MGFFDGLSKKTAEISSSVQESVNKSQRESKCKKSINENKNKIEATYSEIGKLLYEKRDFGKETKAEVIEKIESIEALIKENEELNKEVLTLNNKKICPNCQKEIELNLAFCPQCGTEQEKIEVEVFVPKGKRKCSGCGEVIDDKNEFCPNCGTKKEVVEEIKEEKESEEKKESKKEDKKKEDDVPEGKVKCSSCGELNDEDDTFCANCGNKM